MAWKQEYFDYFAFENSVAKTISGLGLKVNQNVALNGQLVDVIAAREDKGGKVERIAFELKATKEPLGRAATIGACLQLAGLLKDRVIDRAIIVSLSGFTPSAKRYATQVHMVPVTVDDLPAYLTALRQTSRTRKTKRSPVVSSKRRIFVAIPYKAPFFDVYDAIKEVAGPLGLAAELGPDIQDNGQIIDSIYKKIESYDFVIADLTGKNPNVFYEVGYSHRIKPENTILLAKKARLVPFDLRGRHLVEYDSLRTLRRRLREKLRAALKSENMAAETPRARQRGASF